jgi:hypothetical protein
MSKANTLTRSWQRSMAKEAMRLIVADKTDRRDFDDCWENGSDTHIAWELGRVVVGTAHEYKVDQYMDRTGWKDTYRKGKDDQREANNRADARVVPA